MLSNSEIGDGGGKNLKPFQAWRDNNGFWSDFGYDGLSLVFVAPLISLQTLPEAKKLALFRLLVYLADTPNDALPARVQALATQPAEQRLVVLLNLSARFGE